jgi:predicted RNase H-like nuclease
MVVVGVDGCKGGWVIVEWNVDTGTITLDVLSNFGLVLEKYPEGTADAIAIDIPIGLIECARQCDVEAKAVLNCRKPSVFPAPDPRVVCVPDYQEARLASTELCGKSISAQAFGIFPKVCEVNELMTPGLQNRVIEIHPEVSFWAMNGFEEICPPKRTGPGYMERWNVLREHLDLQADAWKTLHGGVKRAQHDDVLDAMAAAWTARRWAVHPREAGRFPAVEERDAKGLRAEIVY